MTRGGIPPILAVLALLTLPGCAGGPSRMDGGGDINVPPPETDTGAVISEVGSPRDRAKAHTELAGAYFERGNLGVALEEVRQAVAADSNYAPAYNVLGLVHMDLRENPQAQQAFERALRINPNDADTNHNYAWFLCQTQREEQSIRFFLNSIRNPLYATPQKSYTLAGVCALRKNNEQDALDYFDRALRLDPNWLPAVMSLAHLRYRRGELEEAQRLVGRFNKIVEPTAESLWLALRIERKLGDRAAEGSYATQLRRRFPGSREYVDMQKGQFE